jgi:hypothetical protein
MPTLRGSPALALKLFCEDRLHSAHAWDSDGHHGSRGSQQDEQTIHLIRFPTMQWPHHAPKSMRFHWRHLLPRTQDERPAVATKPVGANPGK